MSASTEPFFRYLAMRCAADRAAVACLRRSLSYPPGEWPRAFQYIEPFIGGAGEWRRKMFYLVGGVWASAKERNGTMPFGKAVSEYMRKTLSESTEKRFLALLEADADQLPRRLCQVCALLKDFPVSYASLLEGVLFWNAKGKQTQWRWARDFYIGEPTAAAAPAGVGEEA